MRAKVESWVSAGRRTPCLAVILVGDNPASESYVRGKRRRAAVGIKTIRLSSSSLKIEKTIVIVRRMIQLMVSDSTTIT